MRALLDGLTGGCATAREPPASARAAHRRRHAGRARPVRFPAIPANNYGGVARPALRYLGVHNPLHVLDFGARLSAGRHQRRDHASSRRASARPRYGVLVPQVDADGNDIGGVRSLYVRVPLGTYTGWN